MEARAISNTYTASYMHCALYFIYPRSRCCNYIHFTKQKNRCNEKTGVLQSHPAGNSESVGKIQHNF